VAIKANKGKLPGSIFLDLQRRNEVELRDCDYNKIWKVIRNLHYKDFMSKEQGLITLKYLKGENVFGVLPTSGGKSFTFQAVAGMTDGLTIVISPLIALMKDQVYNHRDGKTAYYNSDLSDSKKRIVKKWIRKGLLKLLYISPERLKSEEFKHLLKMGENKVKRIVIDEAHCVIEWGYSFRTKYLHVAQEIETFEKHLKEKIPVLLLTATASRWLQEETANKLRVTIPPENYIVQKKEADRPELHIRLRAVKNDAEKIRYISGLLGPGGFLHNKMGIIFSAFAEGGEGLGAMQAPNICKKLQESGIKKIDCYHGGMDIESRKVIQKKFPSHKLRILVATKAFGMGIDLPKLDFIIHFYPPLSLEEYWQEAGRGGRKMNVRKGEKCQCIVLHDEADQRKLQGFPAIARFDKILTTFTCVATRELYLSTNEIPPNGKLRKMLNRLHEKKDIRKLTPKRIANVEFERWKLRKPASVVHRHVEKMIDNENMSNKSTKRLRSNLRISADRKGGIVRVRHEPYKLAANNFMSELNWLTEPEVGALKMIDDKWKGSMLFERFKIIRKKLSRAKMKKLAKIINKSRREGYNKLEYVFNKFLRANRGKSKAIILRYLGLKAKPT